MKIHRLDPKTAEQIAAGEVIERPASIVKEAVENALDAGATEIQVHLEAGGKNRIEIIDNGFGMARDDLELCIERHATSKIQKFDDLLSIHSFGFRGEALPSMAAVGQLSILSRAKNEADTYEICAGQNAERTLSTDFLGSPHGTRLRLDSLFSTVPARLKFLKSPSAEISAVREWIERLSLTHPRVGFKCTSDGRTFLNLRPESESERVRTILGDGEDYPIHVYHSEETERKGSFPRVRLYYLQGLSVPHSRKLYQIVNGRVLKDRLIQQAMQSPFRQAFLPGKFPALTLFLELPPDEIDVNVHPSKTEVRFQEGNRIFAAIHHAGESLIQTQGAPAFVAGPALNSTAHAHASMTHSLPTSSLTASASTPSQTPFEWTAPIARFSEPDTASPLSDSSAVQATQHSDRPHPFPEIQFARYLGAAFNTYLILDLGKEAVLIDQHAAHERVQYEKFKAAVQNKNQIHSQRLLTPEVIPFKPEDRLKITKFLHRWAELGFEWEFFSDEKLLVREVPAAWGTELLPLRLKSLLEHTLEKGEEALKQMDEVLFEELASNACHSSVRAHDVLHPQSAQKLVQDLFLCEHPWNCPHGRPTVVRIPENRFKEWFQR